MADIPYINPGDELDAATWNTLFAQADAKLSTILSNHSLLWWNSPLDEEIIQLSQGVVVPSTALWARGFSGLCFWFGQNLITDTVFTAFDDYRVYDHQIFLDYVASILPPSQHDDGVKLLTPKVQSIIPWYARLFGSRGTPSGTNFFLLTSLGTRNFPSLLDFSLQSHTVNYTPDATPAVPYKILDAGQYPCEHVRTYDAVEMVFTSNFSIPDAWNKYNFFRLHNFSQKDIVVAFVGFSVAVPAFGSKCVRRTGVGGTYTLGYNHFWPMLPGDPRTWFPNKTPWNVTSLTNVAHNNVINPNIVSQLFAAMTNTDGAGDNPQLGGRIVEMDWAKSWDMSSLYCGDGRPFPLPTDNTLIGDMIVHRGNLLSVKMPSGMTNQRKGASQGTQAFRYPIAFRGFGSMAQDFQAGGITVTPDGNGGYNLKSDLAGNQSDAHDIVDMTSNFCITQGGDSTLTLTPFGNASASEVLNLPPFTRGIISSNLFQAWEQSNALTLVSTVVQSGTPNAGPFASFQVQSINATIPGLAFIPQGISVGQVLDQTPATNVNTVTRHYRFSPWGFFVWWDTSVKLSAPPVPGYSFGRVSGNTALTRVTGWIPNGFPNPLNGDMAVNSFRSPANIGHFRFIGNVTSIVQMAFPVSVDVGRGYPDWIYTSEKHDLTDSEVQGIADSVELPGCTICRPYQEINAFHITAAYCAKTGINLVKQWSFGNEQDGNAPLPSGFNTQWPQIRNDIVNNTGSWDIQDGAGGAIPGKVVFERMPMLAEHYNGIASYVNCVSRYIPLNATNIFSQFCAPSRLAGGISKFETLISTGVTTQTGTYAFYPAESWITTTTSSSEYAGFLALVQALGTAFRTTVDSFPVNSITSTSTVSFNGVTRGFSWLSFADVSHAVSQWGLGFNRELIAFPGNVTVQSDGKTLDVIYSTAGAWEKGVPLESVIITGTGSSYYWNNLTPFALVDGFADGRPTLFATGLRFHVGGNSGGSIFVWGVATFSLTGFDAGQPQYAVDNSQVGVTQISAAVDGLILAPVGAMAQGKLGVFPDFTISF